MSLFQPLWQPAATTAATIPFTPSGGLTEPTVEGALIELDTKKLAIADIDDAPVNGVTNAPISSNWAYDHAASTAAHGVSGAIVGTTDTQTLSAKTLLNYSETLYSPSEITASTLTIDLNNGNVQRFTINPSGASTAITLPSDPGAISKSFVLMIENATGKAHTWAVSPVIKWMSEYDSDSVPTPAAANYVTVYSFVWDDNDAGTGRWLGWLGGVETA